MNGWLRGYYNAAYSGSATIQDDFSREVDLIYLFNKVFISQAPTILIEIATSVSVGFIYRYINRNIK